jgi:hypothetical protein
MIRALFWLALAAPLAAQTVQRLPLPVDGPPSAQTFEAGGPTAAVLTGFLVPSSGPVTSWAPVFRTLGADGRLTAEQSGAWNGPLPARWIKASKEGAVVAGMRVLVSLGPGPVQTRQIQVFWQPWRDGAPRGPVTQGPVYGQAAADRDTVRIIELRVPEGAVAVGMYGQLFAGAVVQASLLVRVLDLPSATAEPRPLSGPQAPTAPQAPSSGGKAPAVPGSSGPSVPKPPVPVVPDLPEPTLEPLPNPR